MHGIIFSSLRSFVIQKTKPENWTEILDSAGIPTHTMFMPIKTYPDADLLKIIGAASENFKTSVPKFLESFGEYLIQDLIKFYHSWIKPEWSALDFFTNVECVMHTAARAISVVPGQEPTPPELVVERIAPNQIKLIYKSPRKLCHLAKGLIQGVSQYYHEEFNIVETSCMHSGGAVCCFQVTSKKT